MGKPLRVLLVEDSEDDATLIALELRRAGYQPALKRVETSDAMSAALAKQTWDLVISDYILPQFSGPAALALFKETGLDLPFIIVSGKIGEDAAVEAMKAGAHDCIMKYNLARLAPAIERELREAEVHQERKRAEEALRESEDKYRIVTENSPHGIYIFQDGKLKFVNQALERMSGYTKEELMSMDYLNLIHPDYRDMMDKATKQALTGDISGLPPRPEFKIMRKNGEIGWAQLMPAIIEYAGRPAIIGNVTDITQRKQAEEKVRESEEKYRSLVDSTDDSIWMVDRDCRLAFANARYLSRLGLPADKVIGRKYGEFHSPEDEKELAEKVRAVFEAGRSLQYEYRSQRDNRHFLRTLSPVRAYQTGQPEFVTIVSKDITKRKELEDTLRKSERQASVAIEAARALTFNCSIASGKVEWGGAIEEITGCTREEFAKVDIEEWADRIHPDEREEVLAILQEAMGKDRATAEYRFKTKKGYVTLSCISLTEKQDGKAVRLVGILQDITERKQIEAERLRASKVESLSILAGGIAHDFNNLLAGILGITQLLIKRTSDAKFRKRLKIIEEAALDGAEMVKRMQGFAGATRTTEKKPLQLNQVVTDAVEVTRPSWEEETKARGVKIKLETQLRNLPLVSGNASELKELLVNLILNSMQAMPKGGTLSIATSTSGNQVSISIADTGVGMSSEVKQKIFDPFFTTKGEHGTGLGLSLAYGIVTSHGGEILVDSQEGQGTKFTIVLPARVTPGSPHPPEMTPSKRGPRKILVIEDDPIVREAIIALLTEQGHLVMGAADAEEGLELFNPEYFELVLVDLGLPGMNGWQVAQEIKQLSKDTVVGLITGWGAQISLQEAKSRQVDFVLAKPVDANDLESAVQAALASRKPSSQRRSPRHRVSTMARLSESEESPNAQKTSHP